jgi:hypothetical protein
MMRVIWGGKARISPLSPSTYTTLSMLRWPNLWSNERYSMMAINIVSMSDSASSFNCERAVIDRGSQPDHPACGTRRRKCARLGLHVARDGTAWKISRNILGVELVEVLFRPISTRSPGTKRLSQVTGTATIVSLERGHSFVRL